MSMSRKLISGLVAMVVAVSTVVAISLQASSEPGPTFGRIPDSAFRDDGTVDVSQAPDFVIAYGRSDAPVGYVRKEDILPVDGRPTDNSGKIPVFDRDGTTILGFMIERKGFVPLGQDPDDVESVTVTTTFEG